MFDGTRRQQHCTTLFHVIGFYSPIIEAILGIKRNKDYIQVLRHISIEKKEKED